MRSPFDLISTVAEAKTGGGVGNTAVSLGGGQGGAFGATLDGVSVNTNRQADITETAFLTPSLEAITEFAVETNGFKPEFGQAGGGGITFASKSGTNVLQGSAYGFFRHDALDQKGFFEQTKGIYKQSDFGGSLGGPVRIPGMLQRTGTGRSSSRRTRASTTSRAATPRSAACPRPKCGTETSRTGSTVRDRRITIYDPATTRPNPNGAGFIRDPFPNNRIPVERFSTVAQAVHRAGQIGARAESAGDRAGHVRLREQQLRFRRPQHDREDEQVQREDRSHAQQPGIASPTCSTGRTTAPEPGPNGANGLPEPFNDSQESTFDGDLHRVSWDWVGARMVNHLTVGANTFNKNSFSPNVDQNWQDRVCIPNSVDCNQNMGAIQFTELSTWGGASYNGTEQPRFTIKDDLTLTRGSHTIKTGFTYDRQQANGFGQQDIGGRARFSFLQTGRPRRHELRQRRRQLVRLVPARVRQRRANRDDSLSEADLPVLRVLCAGRLAAQQEAGDQLRRAVRVHAAARRGRRSVLGLRSDKTEPGGEQLSGRARVRRGRGRP